MESEVLSLPEAEPKEVSAATVLIPYSRSDNRSKYLGWLCCGFSDEEALFILRLNVAWLESARQEDKFADLEEHIPELRKTLSKEYAEIDFYRNFRMVLEKDHRVLRKALDMERELDDETGQLVTAELTPYDQQYLLKLRSAYTPQQLQLLEEVVSGKGPGFNFAEWVSKNAEVISASRTETIVAKIHISE